MKDITIARCPQCLAVKSSDHPNCWECGSRTDGTHQSMVCEAAEKRRKEMPSFLIPENKRLQEFVDKYPKTKDGVTATPLMRVYFPPGYSEYDDDGIVHVSVCTEGGTASVTDAYSTRAAAQAVKGKP